MINPFLRIGYSAFGSIHFALLETVRAITLGAALLECKQWTQIKIPEFAFLI